MKKNRFFVILIFSLTTVFYCMGQDEPRASFYLKERSMNISCGGATVEFINLSICPKGDSCIYEWNFGDGEIKTKTDTLNVRHTYNKDKEYDVELKMIKVVVSPTDTVLSDLDVLLRQKYLKVYAPVANFPDVPKTDSISSYTVNFESNGFKPFEPNAWIYIWDFGDGNSAKTDSTSISHSYSDENLDGYDVRLTVTFDSTRIVDEEARDRMKNCFSTKLSKVKVYDDFFQNKEEAVMENRTPVIVTQNVITPNGDGINDVFDFNTNGEDIFQLSIFNNLGKKIYYEESQHPRWDAKLGESRYFDSGTYYYIIKSNKEDERHETTGFFQVLTGN